MRATAKGEGTMRRAEAEAVINDLPSEAYDFDERGATSLVNKNTDPGKLDAMATMLNNDPRQLLRRVFRPNPALLRAVNAAAATLLAVIKTAPRTIEELLKNARARLNRVDPRAVRDEVDRGALLVDTRCAEARQTSGVIPGSVHVPLSVLYWRLDPTSGFDDRALSDHARRIILVCAEG
jgi:hypothetical protein